MCDLIRRWREEESSRAAIWKEVRDVLILLMANKNGSRTGEFVQMTVRRTIEYLVVIVFLIPSANVPNNPD